MSGSRAPTSLALAWCGWLVDEPVDLALNEEHDLSTRRGQELAQIDAEYVDAWVIGLECSTLSRIREVRRPGMEHSRQLRSDNEPHGLSNLCEADMMKVAQASLYIDFVCVLIYKVAQGGGAAG